MLMEQAAEPKTKRGQTRTQRWLAIIAGVLLLAVIVDFVIILRHWPFTQKALTEALQKHASGAVQIGRFHETYFPPGCIAEDVTIPPGLTARKLIIRGNYGDLLLFRKHIDELRVSGVHVVFPPKNSGERMPFSSQGKSDGSLGIGKAVAEDALLEFRPKQQGQEPYRIAIERLVLPHFAADTSLPYDVKLTISKPPGAIESKGKFGPWNSKDPSRTPVSGSFTYTHANLGISQKVTGILNGNGKFDGVLGEINVHGSTDIPDFHIHGSAHKLRMTTEYQAVVNGMNGDTFLKSVQDHVLRSTGVFEGSVAGEQGREGKFISLDMRVHDGRVEDILLLFTSDKRASMDGAISLHGHARVPPGSRPFLEKLLITGDFSIAEAHFTKPSTQQPINRLSESAAGEKKDQIEEDQRMVLENVKAHVSTKNGVATLTNITFAVPGALARMAGTFNLQTKMVDLHGVLDTTGKLSDSTTNGFKSFVLKAITPFYKKKPKLTVIPFRITGPIGHTSIGLDTGK